MSTFDSILVIDDEWQLVELLSEHLRRWGYEVQSASSGEAGLALALAMRPRLILLDLRLGDISGLEVLARVKTALPDVQVVIMTGHREVSAALSATAAPAVDYLDKPFTSERLAAVVERALRTTRPDRLAPAASPEVERGPDLVGESEATRRVRAIVRHVAESDVRTLLVSGESGTGKELVARLFHALGPRRGGPFIEVNCAAVTESLFESEFFGHERGAFTGAVTTRRGLAELADGGTLFLDEIGDMPRSGQAKLLRFLEDQSFYRVGGTRRIQVDVRIVAATNGDLRAMVEQQTFRGDLFFRLAVAAVTLFPLRRRMEDIAPLAAYWLEEANTRYGKQVAGFVPEAEAMLLRHTWPGNVRELRNMVERLVLFCPGRWITVSQLEAEHVTPLLQRPEPVTEAPTPLKPLAAIERAHIRSVLDRVGGNKTRAAEILGISRQTLRAKLEIEGERARLT